MAVKALTIMKKQYDQGSNPGAVVVFPTKKVQMELHAMNLVQVPGLGVKKGAKNPMVQVFAPAVTHLP